MAEHEHTHTRTIHLYHIELPNGQTPQSLEFEPGSLGYDWRDCFNSLTANYDEEEIRRVLAGTVALLQKFPHRTLGEALDTAMVWERG